MIYVSKKPCALTPRARAYYTPTYVVRNILQKKNQNHARVPATPPHPSRIHARARSSPIAQSPDPKSETKLKSFLEPHANNTTYVIKELS